MKFIENKLGMEGGVCICIWASGGSRSERVSELVFVVVSSDGHRAGDDLHTKLA